MKNILSETHKEVNMKYFKWEEGLCECYTWLLFSQTEYMKKILSERNVHVNVTYKLLLFSQSEG
jgi:hypothetical protein